MPLGNRHKRRRSFMASVANKNAKSKAWKEANKEVLSFKRKKWREENPELAKERDRKHHLSGIYGITLEERDQILKDQDHKCAICKNLVAFSGTGGATIDHCHDTDKIRGILCKDCNTGLGHFKDDISTLFNAINYLRDFTGWGKKKIS